MGTEGDHRIRLRGGWEWLGADDTPGSTRRVTLPLIWPPDAPARVRLLRSFRRPPIDPAQERVSLDLSQVPGLCAVLSNGVGLALPDREFSYLTVGLGDLRPDRNQLILEIDTSQARRLGGATAFWGDVALVISRLAAADEFP